MRFSLCQDSKNGPPGQRRTRTGYRHSHAGDAVLLTLAEAETESGGDAMLADMATLIALQTLAGAFEQAAASGLLNPDNFLCQAFGEVEQSIERYRERIPFADPPRMSLVVCIIREGAAQWAGCGKARLFWLRDGRILARSVATPSANDETADAGRPGHAWPLVEASRRARLAEGDVILLASSALTGALPDHRLAHEVRRGDVGWAIPALLDAAVGSPGKNSDNVSALAIRWGEGGERREPAVPAPPAGQAMVPQAARHADLTEDVFNETEIERAIEEIRGAIARSSR